MIADQTPNISHVATLNRNELAEGASSCDFELLQQAKRLVAAEPTAVQTFADNHLSRYELNSVSSLYDETQQALDQPAIVLHSSGTTHRPKAILLSHRNLITNAIGKLSAMPQFDIDRRLNLLPFAHAYARTCELGTWAIAGGAMFCASGMEQAQTVSVKLKPTLLNAVPSIYHRLQHTTSACGTFSKDRLLGGCLRMIASGGAGLDDETFHAYMSIGLPIHQGYGLTETSPVVCSSRFGEVHNNSVGPAIEGVELRTDADQQLWVRGPNVMLGYYQDSVATRNRFDDGWFASGDLAAQLPNGHWRILGRIDDRITLTNGYKVNPIELEEQLIKLAKQTRLVVCSARKRLVVLSFVEGDQENHEHLLHQLMAAAESIPSPIRPTACHVHDWHPALATSLLNAKGQWIRRRVAEFAESVIE